jgi:hypothetical protein
VVNPPAKKCLVEQGELQAIRAIQDHALELADHHRPPVNIVVLAPDLRMASGAPARRPGPPPAAPARRPPLAAPARRSPPRPAARRPGSPPAAPARRPPPRPASRPHHSHYSHLPHHGPQRRPGAHGRVVALSRSEPARCHNASAAPAGPGCQSGLRLGQGGAGARPSLGANTSQIRDSPQGRTNSQANHASRGAGACARLSPQPRALPPLRPPAPAPSAQRRGESAQSWPHASGTACRTVPRLLFSQSVSLPHGRFQYDPVTGHSSRRDH